MTATDENSQRPEPGYPPPSGPPVPDPQASNTFAFGNPAPPYGPPPPAPPASGGGRGRARMGAIVVAASLLSAVLGGVAGSYLTGGNSPVGRPSSVSVDPAALSREAGSISALADKASKSTVTVLVPTSRGMAQGSGFVYDNQGHILTNAHVVDAGENDGIKVTLPSGDQVKAQLVGSSKTYDLAVLKLEDPGKVPAIPLGSSEAIKAGDTVIAVGSPHGLNNTVTSGIVSAVNRPWPVGAAGQGGQKYMSALQTDAAINEGNSGGPLINGQGQVVGINTSIETSGGDNPFGQQSKGSIGLGFAIPIDQAKRVADQLAGGGKATFPIAGVSLQAGQSDTRSGGQTGAVVGQVQSGSGAAKAGLKEGDVITKVDSTPITAPEELMAAIWRKAPGQSAKLTYERGGKQGTADVTLDAQEVA